jgi:hypothetical protein
MKSRHAAMLLFIAIHHDLHSPTFDGADPTMEESSSMGPEKGKHKIVNNEFNPYNSRGMNLLTVTFR